MKLNALTIGVGIAVLYLVTKGSTAAKQATLTNAINSQSPTNAPVDTIGALFSGLLSPASTSTSLPTYAGGGTDIYATNAASTALLPQQSIIDLTTLLPPSDSVNA